jgi:hypothetical protein
MEYGALGYGDEMAGQSAQYGYHGIQLPKGLVVAVPLLSGAVFAVVALIIAAAGTLDRLTLIALLAGAIVVGISPMLVAALWNRGGGPSAPA